ncbi:MAG: DUF308 domain-containing protein [Acidobacteriota bacterium]
MKIFGVIAIVLGVLAMLAPLQAGISVAVLVGLFVLISGVLRMVWAFESHTFGRGLLKFVVGGLTLICGIVLVADPILASGFLTVLVSLYLIVDGAFEIVAATRLRAESGWSWMFFGGIVSIVLGLILWAQFPLVGAWAIGIQLGIKLLFVGMIMVTLGTAYRAVTARG